MTRTANRPLQVNEKKSERLGCRSEKEHHALKYISKKSNQNVNRIVTY